MRDLEVLSTSWHYKLYCFCAKTWFQFLGTDWKYNHWREHTNLCFYIRVILVWAPLMIMTHLMLLGAFVFTFWWYPQNMFGLGSFYTVMGIILVIIALVVGFVYLIDSVKVSLSEREKPDHHKKSAAFRFGKSILSFLKLVWCWLEDAKKGICSEITVKEA